MLWALTDQFSSC